MTLRAATRVLIVDDEESIRFPVRAFLEHRGYEVAEAANAQQAESIAGQLQPEAVVLDWSLPDGDALEVLRRLRAIDPGVVVCILTGYASIERAVAAIQQGADQFLTKPLDLPALAALLERLIAQRRFRRRDLAAESRDSRDRLDPFFGESAAIRRLAVEAHRLVNAASPILLLGETGSGKGVIARWLHQNSVRREEAWVDLNCAGLGREFLESELFGHSRGAYTGATADKQGLFEVAHRGTLFLDEVGDLPPEIQPKLLKALDEQRFRRLGEVRERQVHVRFISATHQNLDRRVAEGSFRRDLFFRISTLPLPVPPLRARRDDILPLARRILERLASDVARAAPGLEPSAESALLAHDWPGNLRELRNVLERALLRSSSERLDASDLDLAPASAEGAASSSDRSLKAAERRQILAILKEEGSDVARAAATLGLSRSALYQKLRAHGIPTPRRLS